MKFKKIMLISFILLAVLTIGAVSASDDNNVNEALTASDVQETIDVSLDDAIGDMGPEDVEINVENIDRNDPEANFTVISVTEKEGNFVICTGEGDDTIELYREDLSTSDRDYDDAGMYCFGVSFDDVNAYIEENVPECSNFDDVISPGDSLRFVLEYQGDDFVIMGYTVDFGEDTIEFGEGEDFESDDNWWEVSGRDAIGSRDSRIVRVDAPDEGTILVTITKFDGDSKTYEKGVDDKDEEGQIAWTLEDLDIIDEVGFYNITVVYNNGEEEITLEENVEFLLTQLAIDNYWDDKIHIDYPFDVLRIFDEEANFRVYVNDVPYELARENPFRWNLRELGIDSVGEYEIKLEALDEDENIIDTYTFTLNVCDDSEFEQELMIFSDSDVFDADAPVLYVYCLDDNVRNITIALNDEMLDDTFEITREGMNWTLEDLGIDHNDWYNIKLYEISEENPEGREIDQQIDINVCCIVGNPDWEIYGDEFYTDFEDPVIGIYVPDGRFGKLEVIVDGVSKYLSNVYPNNDYEWNLITLNITDLGNHNIVVKFIDEDENEETLLDETIEVTTFENETFRAKLINDRRDFALYCPEGAEGIITVSIFDFDEHDLQAEFTYEINSTYYNEWTLFSYDEYDLIDFDVEVDIVGENVHVERGWNKDGYGFYANDDEINDDNEVIGVSIPFDRNASSFTLNITGKNYNFSKRLSENDEYEWKDGMYYYAFGLNDLDSFDALSDKEVVKVSVSCDSGISSGAYSIQKDDETFRLVECHLNAGAGVDFGDDEDSLEIWNSSRSEDTFLTISIPFDSNITEAQITITAGDKVILTKNVFAIENIEYDYGVPGYRYAILFGDLDFAGVNDKDIINATLTSNGRVLDYQRVIFHVVDDENVAFHEFLPSIEFSVHYGLLIDPEHAMDIHDDTFIVLDIPSYLNITEGTVEITGDDGNVYFAKSISSFENAPESYYNVSFDEYGFNEYVIYADEDFFNTYIPENVNLTFSFNYSGNKQIMKGIRKGDALYKILVVGDVARLFTITIEDKVLVDGAGSAIHIAESGANRQSIYFDLGGGHFNIYVNGKKVEDLGRLVRVDGETDLDLFRLTGHQDAWIDLYIYLADLNITENGVYDIRVTHSPGQTNGDQYDEDDYLIYTETELYHNSNLTLTSNVKVNYQNSSVELLTGYGLNPKLMYLDTYYDSIDDVTGKITVLNSAGEEIFSSDISALPSDENGRYLSYLSFKNDNFGDSITVIYGDGNQRSGNTTLNVLWRNATTEDFTPAVDDNVNDYYGDFVNLNIPDVINTGQIIVTIKFRNNHGSNISNMNVTTDFDSQAVYRFNVADIKANYGNDFALALSDLGFFEDNGDYDVYVEFTGDGTDSLEIANSTVNVEFSHDILITINETSRYSVVLPFAKVQVFEPIAAYAELYIDGKLYSHKNFEKGLIIFDSSASWAPGSHTAELIVCTSEFGTLLNSSSITFETLTNTEDVEVTISDKVKENENAFVNITVPKAGKATVIIDGRTLIVDLDEGLNTIDLGVLSYGNHSIWINYNVTNDDGSVSFYNNYLTLFVDDDGHWMNLPQTLVLNDDESISFNLGSDAKGYVSLYIDGELVANLTLINGSAETTISQYLKGENIYGEHSYIIEYYDENGNLALSKNGTFNVAYLFKDDIVKEGVPLRESYEITITLPTDAKGNVTLAVDGKASTADVVNGQATFNIENLTMGEHDVLVKYTGDDKYPVSSYNNVLNVSYYGVVGNFKDGKRIISLMLPTNATGSLTVYNNNRRSVLFSKAMVNGKASIDLNDLPVGIYDLIAYYEGDDYDVRTFECSFKVLPEVNITSEVIIGDNVTVSMDLNGASGSILIVVDGLTPALCDIIDGKVFYTFSTEELAYGDHSIYFIYFGTSFDGDVFNEIKDNGRYEFVMYYWKALPRIVDPIMDSDDRMAYISVGNATGTIEVFIDGVSQGVVNILNGIAGIDLSGFANGKHTITWAYSGDDKYAPFTESSSYTVNNRIVADNLKVLYSANQKYSVTVYGSENHAMSGVTVNFLINNKAYASAKTNEKGVASIIIKSNPGTYTITSKISSVSISKKITVNHVVDLKKVTVKRAAKKLVLTATLKKVNGKYLKNKKVTFKFNGKKYTAKTNKKGIAKVTIKSSVLKKLKVGKKITYQATYLKDTVKRSVKVKK